MKIHFTNFESFYDIPLIDLGNWFLADPQENCEHTCKNNNLVCSEDQLRLHDRDVDDLNIINVLTDMEVWMNTARCLPSNDFTITSDYDAADFPLIVTGIHWKCYHSVPGRPKNKFDCLRKPTATSTNKNKRRLCYCVKQIGMISK